MGRVDGAAPLSRAPVLPAYDPNDLEEATGEEAEAAEEAVVNGAAAALEGEDDTTDMNEWLELVGRIRPANGWMWVDVAEVRRASNGQTYAIPCLSSPRCDAANHLLIAAPFGLL